MICAPWDTEMFHCLADGRDHTPCCAAKQVDDEEQDDTNDQDKVYQDHDYQGDFNDLRTLGHQDVL